MTSVHDFTLRTIDGSEQSLSEYAGKTLLLVNVASKCGLTPQYEALEKLYRAHQEDGLVVLGVPCNQFGAQEPGTEADIKDFCTTQYDVTFPMFAKVEVNGPDRHPLFGYLTEQSSTPDGPGDIAWNFTKFVVNGQGRLVARFSPQTAPDDPAVLRAVDSAKAT